MAAQKLSCGKRPGESRWWVDLPRSPPRLPQIHGTCLGKVPGIETPPGQPSKLNSTLRLQDAYDISQLRHPTELAALAAPLGRPPLRRDAPFGRARPPPPRALPTSPADIADFINDVGPPGVGEEGGGTHVHTHTHTPIHANHVRMPLCTPVHALSGGVGSLLGTLAKLLGSS